MATQQEILADLEAKRQQMLEEREILLQKEASTTGQTREEFQHKIAVQEQRLSTINRSIVHATAYPEQTESIYADLGYQLEKSVGEYEGRVEAEKFAINITKSPQQVISEDIYGVRKTSLTYKNPFTKEKRQFEFGKAPAGWQAEVKKNEFIIGGKEEPFFKIYAASEREPNAYGYGLPAIKPGEIDAEMYPVWETKSKDIMGGIREGKISGQIPQVTAKVFGQTPKTSWEYNIAQIQTGKEFFKKEKEFMMQSEDISSQFKLSPEKFIGEPGFKKEMEGTNIKYSLGKEYFETLPSYKAYTGFDWGAEFKGRIPAAKESWVKLPTSIKFKQIGSEIGQVIVSTAISTPEFFINIFSEFGVKRVGIKDKNIYIGGKIAQPLSMPQTIRSAGFLESPVTFLKESVTPSIITSVAILSLFGGGMISSTLKEYKLARLEGAGRFTAATKTLRIFSPLYVEEGTLERAAVKSIALEQPIISKGVRLGLGEGKFIDYYISYKENLGAKMITKTKIAGFQAGEKISISGGKQQAIIEQWEVKLFGKSKPTGRYFGTGQKIKGLSVGLGETETGLFISISKVGTQKSWDFAVLKTPEKSYGKINIYGNAGTEFKVFGGISKREGDIIMGLGGETQKAIRTDAGFFTGFETENINLLKVYKKAPEKDLIGIGKTRQITKQISPPSLIGIQASVEKQASSLISKPMSSPGFFGRTRISNMLKTRQIESSLISSLLIGITTEKTKTKEMLKGINRNMLLTAITPTQLTRQFQFQVPIQRYGTLQRQQQITTEITSPPITTSITWKPGYPSPVIIPNMGFPPLFMSEGRRKRQSRGRSYQYTPSLAALGLNIKARKVPGLIETGLVLRPIISKRRKKK